MSSLTRHKRQCKQQRLVYSQERGGPKIPPAPFLWIPRLSFASRRCCCEEQQEYNECSNCADNEGPESFTVEFSGVTTDSCSSGNPCSDWNTTTWVLDWAATQPSGYCLWEKSLSICDCYSNLQISIGGKDASTGIRYFALQILYGTSVYWRWIADDPGDPIDCINIDWDDSDFSLDIQGFEYCCNFLSCSFTVKAS